MIYSAKRILPLFFLFCSSQLIFGQNTSISGIWRAEIPTVAGPLPFQLEVSTQSKPWKAWAINGEERLELDTPVFVGDSLHIPMEIFDATIVVKVEGDRMTGKLNRKTGSLALRSTPLKAVKGNLPRFSPVNSTPPDFAGTYDVKFTDATGKILYPAVGIFKQKGSDVQATFLTTTGDYRYLAGQVVGDSLFLSCFDGNHVFLFKAKVGPKQLTGGTFCAAFTYTEKWEATWNPSAALPDPTTLTFLKPGYSSLDFSFKNTQGKTISLKDPAYRGKVVLVQIMGSWCPNCMDESRFLAPYYQKNKKRGLEIIGLAYEKSTDPSFAYPKLDRMKERFGIQYEVLLAGTNDKSVAAASLPALEKVLSFPTLIVIDKKGMVREIHTGFSGPGTGVYYDKFKSDFTRLMDQLLAE